MRPSNIPRVEALIGDIEVFDKPIAVPHDDGKCYVYAKDPSVEVSPDTHPADYHSYVSNDRLIGLGAKEPHSAGIVGKVGEVPVYFKMINNRVGPFGVELSLMSPRTVVATQLAHYHVRKSLKKLIKSNHDTLQTS